MGFIKFPLAFLFVSTFARRKMLDCLVYISSKKQTIFIQLLKVTSEITNVFKTGIIPIAGEFILVNYGVFE